MSHARVEEVSDSDPDDMDPSDFDPAKDSIIYHKDIETPPSNSIPHRPAARPTTASPSPPLFPSSPQVHRPSVAQGRDIPRSYQCLYPVYFDKSRTRAEGRRVSRKLAVDSPLAKDILDATQLLGLTVGFEPDKLHPKDWSNPGRVRVMLKDEDRRPASSSIKNSTSSYLCFNTTIPTNHWYRTPAIHTRCTISASPSDHGTDSLPAAATRHAYTGQAPRTTGHATGMENQQHPALALACADWRWGKR